MFRIEKNRTGVALGARFGVVAIEPHRVEWNGAGVERSGEEFGGAE